MEKVRAITGITGQGWGEMAQQGQVRRGVGLRPGAQVGSPILEAVVRILFWWSQVIGG